LEILFYFQKIVGCALGTGPGYLDLAAEPTQVRRQRIEPRLEAGLPGLFIFYGFGLVL
jgi:hypothetical protein